MGWFKDHVYIAAWLSPIIGLIGIIVRTPKTTSGDPDWSRILVYLSFLTCLAVTLTPQFDERARSIAGTLLFTGLGFIIVDRRPRP